MVGYGRIIPQWMIDLPPLGNINLHASLLPKYRGAAPIQWAIACGETITGVTTMRIDAGLDTGDILVQAGRADQDGGHCAHARAAPGAHRRGADDPPSLACKAGLTPTPQDDTKATLAPILKRRWPDRFLAHGDRSLEPPARISALAGGVHAVSRQDAALHAAKRVTAVVAPGHFAIEQARLLLGFAHGTALEMQELQPEGKKRMSAQDFINGYRPRGEEKLGG